MAEGKKSFILYSDFISVFEQLSDKEAGLLIKHIFKYVNDQCPELESRTIKIAFEPIRLQLKRDLKDWEDERHHRSEAGRIGGLRSAEVRKAKMKQNEAKPSSASKIEAKSSKVKQSQANQAVTVNDTVTVTDTVNENVTKRERGAFAPPALQDVIFEMAKKLDEFSAMGQGQQFINHYTSNGWMVGKNKMKDWTAAARGWISRMGNYQPKKLNGSRNIHERLQKEGHEKV